MPKKKSTRRRRPKSFRILNALEALAYGQILSTGITGGGLWEFVTGDKDLGYTSETVTDSWHGSQTLSTTLGGTDVISLRDFMSEPTLAIGQMTSNFSANIAPMAIAGLVTGVSFNVGRRVLRRPINTFNRNIMVPLLGHGVKL